MKKRILCLLGALMLLIPSIPASAQEMPEGTSNFSYTFSGANIDNNGDMTTDSNGKTKVVVLFKVDCGHCQAVLQDIANSDWIQDTELAEVCAIAMDTKGTGSGTPIAIKDVADFRTQYCSGANGLIQFGMHSQVSTAMRRYSDAAGLTNNDGTFTTPIIAIVDANNNLRDVTSGSTDVTSTIKAKLEAIKSGKPLPPVDSSQPQKPGDGQKSKDSDSKDSSNNQPACDHVTESIMVSGATDTSDAVEAAKCIKCGEVLSYEKVANSAYSTFLKETADAIANAQQPAVVIDAKMWVSFNRSVFDAIKSRPDVTVTVNYTYGGQKYALLIPAGVNTDSLMDENGFGGFRYIDKVLNTKN